MKVALKIARHELADVLRGRWAVAYAGFFLLLTEALFRFGGGDRVVLSLQSIVLMLIPLVAILFGTMHLYAAREFNELLLAQPIGRGQLFAGLYIGLATPLAVAFLAGVGVPFALHRADVGTLLWLAGAGAALTFVFVALAFLIAVHVDDRVRGLALAIVVWLACAVLYDGAVLLLVDAFSDYPLERPLIAAMALNPVDLARILLLIDFDGAALMGYTGAVFTRFFGTVTGAAVATGALGVWLAAPLLMARRRFARKDF